MRRTPATVPVALRWRLSLSHGGGVWHSNSHTAVPLSFHQIASNKRAIIQAIISRAGSCMLITQGLRYPTFQSLMCGPASAKARFCCFTNMLRKTATVVAWVGSPSSRLIAFFTLDCASVDACHSAVRSYLLGPSATRGQSFTR